MRLSALILLLIFSSAQAGELYRWVDAKGNVTYSDQMPPQVVRDYQRVKVGDNVISSETLPYGVRQAMKDFPVTLYASQDCGKPCQGARAYLKERNIPFAERGLSSEEDIAAYRKAMGEGTVFVPVLILGSQKLKGFDKAICDKLMTDVGYRRVVTPDSGAAQ